MERTKRQSEARTFSHLTLVFGGRLQASNRDLFVQRNSHRSMQSAFVIPYRFLDPTAFHVLLFDRKNSRVQDVVGSEAVHEHRRNERRRRRRRVVGFEENVLS